MQISDSIYDQIEITSPLALEIIATADFQRLKGICQFGMPDRYYHLDGYTRFDHSVGVYYLLQKLGASEEEQIAGLLHDISHTAFSHVVDWVLGDSQTEDCQDKRHLEVLKKSPISEILYRHGYFVEQIADYHRFRLLEQDLPDLCADRVDYALREFPKQVVKTCLPKFRVVKKEIVMADLESGLKFARSFLGQQNEHWGSYEAVTRYVLLSQMIKTALADKIIAMDDLWLTDEEVITKLLSAKRADFGEIFKLLEKKDLSFLPKAKTVTKKKFRYVDPKVMVDGTLRRVSELDQNFKTELAQAKAKNDQGMYAGKL